MAPVYDIRKSTKPSSEDESIEVLDIPSDTFDENTDSSNEGDVASGSGDHVQSLNSMNWSQVDDDKESKMKDSCIKGDSEVPPVDDSVEVLNAPNDEVCKKENLNSLDENSVEPSEMCGANSELEILIGIIDENPDSSNEDDVASGSGGHVQSLNSMNCSQVDDGKESKMEDLYIKGDSEESSADDSVEVLDAPNDELCKKENLNSHDEASVEPSEMCGANSEELQPEKDYSILKNQTTLKSQPMGSNYSINLLAKSEGDTLNRLEGPVDSGINADLWNNLSERHNDRVVSTFVDEGRNGQTCTDYGNRDEEETILEEIRSRGNVHELNASMDAVTSGLKNKETAMPAHKKQTKAKVKNSTYRSVTLESAGKFYSKNKKEYIKRKGPSSTKIAQLGFSARLVYANMEFVIHSKGCLMITDDNFVAKVRLDRPHLLNSTSDFRQATEVLLDRLRIDRVLLDDVTSDRNQHRELFLSRLEHEITQIAMDEGQADIRIETVKLAMHCRRMTYVDLCREVTRNQFKCEALQKHAKILESMEMKVTRRERLLHRFGHYPKDLSPNLFERLDKLTSGIAERHRNILVTKAPVYLHRPLRTINMKNLMLITSNDVKLFTDMSSILKADIFEKPLDDLAKRWINRVQSIKIDRLNKALQLTSSVYFFLCKSLEEVILEITERTDHRATDLLKSSNLGWHPIKKITWKLENAFTKCLQREYDFIFLLLKYFEVASDFGREPFQYEMQLFSNGQSTSRSIFSGAKNALVRTGRFFGYGRREPNPFGVPDDFYVWYCLLDDVLAHVLPEGCDLSMFEHVFEGYIQMIRDENYDQMETLRVVTHNLARFIVQSYSYGGRAPQNASLDMAVLRKQLDIFSFKTNQSVISSNNFRDQVDVFNSFWKTSSDIIDQFPTKINLPEMNLMQERLMEIMLIALNKDVEVETRVAFFRTYNDFLIDLNEISFDWYIKSIPEVDMQSVINLGKVELVDNKWKDTNNRTYRVLDPDNFPSFYKSLGKSSDVPKHYVIEVIQTLLEHIGFQMQRSYWLTDESLSDTDQVLSTNEFIFAIRNSLLYLKEQVDYVSFDLFYDERVKPFVSVLESTTSRQDFSNRIYLIKESFWYIRKQNEISFDYALQLYDELNSSHDSHLLRESYVIYSKFFEEFMQVSVDEVYSERVSLIAEKVKALLSDPVHFKTWDDRFKQDQVPQILAGLAAVWSVLVSKDVANAGKYFNPHCIQILCILRLLSVDKVKPGIDKHLAQVLTGQGKSLVLGLLAALFALTGHKVRIACYSEYLAKRDKQDFLAFFDVFNVVDDVKYGTFDDMANEIIKPEVDGQNLELRNLVSDLLFKDKVIHPHRLVTADSSNYVLLMDEVDVFFTKEYYGNTYNPCVTPIIPGLDFIQEQIWVYVAAGCTTFLEGRIDQFIQSTEFENRTEFLSFLERPNTYTLCEYGRILKTYTNQTLFDEHVRCMIRDAIYVNKGPSNWAEFKLHSGIITYNHRGKHVSSCIIEYQNVFNYFLLQRKNFVTEVKKNKNYGYLIASCGSLSYAILPSDYPLIVGVSGTLTSLNCFENDTINRLYNINQTSVMPTFFGCSNLQFNEVANFHHRAGKSSWRTYIFSKANQKVTANRAVIVFFDTDVELNAFEAEYAGQLDRLNVLTENTEDKERFINEAGVAKTITLATRGMGRGVDYKSSVTVEKNGGVHVIQTFFSMDVKEETQIKGRTARKDNKGSYELIVCDEDLTSCGLLSRVDHVTYTELNTARSKISLDENAELSKKIEDGKDAHQKTMNYMRSFFKA